MKKTKSRYKAYPEYKESGVKWLDAIPAHWHVKKVKYLAQLNPSKNEVRTRAMESMVSFIPMEAIGEKGELDVSRSRELGEVLAGYTYVADGDVMLAKITPCFENGKAAIASCLQGGVGFATTEVIPARPYRANDAKYLYYLFTSMPFRAIAESSMYGAGGQKRVADSFVAEYHYSEPPEKERDTIAAFLDYETARIDRLIEKQQRLIELLKEKRQAVISHAVTKGLNPDAPMKDSGVEWLGEVPEHWDVTRMKYRIKSMDQGWSPQCEARLAEEGEFGVLKVGAVNGGIFKPEEHKALPAELTPRPEYQLKKDQLLISRANTRELVGSAAVVPRDFDYLLLCDKLYRLSLSEDTDPRFTALVLGIHAYRGQIELEATGASDSMQNIGQATIKELPIALPLLDEAKDIVQAVERKLSRLQALSEKLTRRSSILMERRTALISAAVTGKIDVRGWVAPTQPNIHDKVNPQPCEAITQEGAA